MSLTRLAGGRSSSAFFAKSGRPEASSSRTAPAETDAGRLFELGRRASCATAAAGTSKAASAASAVRRLECTVAILASGRSRQQAKSRQRTACFSSFEGLKRGARPPTVTDWPVRGFFSVRGLRRATENVPKPTSVTASPCLSDARIPASSARMARSVDALGHPAAPFEHLRSSMANTDPDAFEGATEAAAEGPGCPFAAMVNEDTAARVPWTPEAEARVERIPEFIRPMRSEERRVGKECRSRWSPYH